MDLASKYSPKTWGDYLGQPKVLKTLDQLRQHGGLAGRAYFVTGKSGTGKGSLAWLLAREVAEEWNITQCAANSLTAARVREMANAARYIGLGAKRGVVLLVDEVHGIRNDVLQVLLVVCDTGNIPAHVVWIFTTTIDNEELLFEKKSDADPFRSRCTMLELTTQGLAKIFAARAQEIAKAEGLDGQPIEKYVRLVNDCKANFRMALNRIGQGEMLIG